MGYMEGNLSGVDYTYAGGTAHYPLWKPPSGYFPRGEAPPPYEEAVAVSQAETLSTQCNANAPIASTTQRALGINSVEATNNDIRRNNPPQQANVQSQHALQLHHPPSTTQSIQHVGALHSPHQQSNQITQSTTNLINININSGGNVTTIATGENHQPPFSLQNENINMLNATQEQQHLQQQNQLINGNNMAGRLHLTPNNSICVQTITAAQQQNQMVVATPTTNTAKMLQHSVTPQQTLHPTHHQTHPQQSSNCQLQIPTPECNYKNCHLNISASINNATQQRHLQRTTMPLHTAQDILQHQSSSNRISKDLPYIGIDYDISGSASVPHSNNPSMMTINGSPTYQPPINYHSSAYKRPNVFITKRIGEAVELEPHLRPPVKVVNPQFRPMTNQMLHHQQQQQQQQQQQPGFLQQLFGIGSSTNTLSIAPSMSNLPQQQQQQQQHQGRPVPLQHNTVQHNMPQTFRAVSENDLYLLGAIEKLVYRVDYLESRIRRAEQLIYYLMAGNNQKEVKDPCPSNFTRISDNCYFINSQLQVNWKTANSACKALGAHLAEFERVSENEEIMAYLLNQPNHRGREYWLGGLNPGLLWIWSNSAKPVNPNMNLTSIAMSHENGTGSSNSESITVDNSDENKVEESTNETVLNNTIEIKGQGRCLRLSYNPTKHFYYYYGQECTSRHHYICEYEDKTLDNKIKKITRELKIFD
ncbi:dual specificity protein kinase splA-like [Teleopsis dalmanni]|uniref:dual specificity protein kinase splA-like n=1 Tax=Teleopsis dalmanni TaxID=139649 RepID=UPI0018CCFDB5|nr:dual specificity protein kinase splA-like [Teleopsis dalmanni]